MARPRTISCPIPSGSGAAVVHSMLESRIAGYRVRTYDPRWELFPPLLRRFADPGAALVHTAPDHAAFVAGRGTPLVVTFHNFVLDRFMRRYSSLAQRAHYALDLPWWTRMALRRARAVTAVSRFTAALAKRELGYAGEIRVIYNGIDTDRFVPAREPRASGAVQVLFSGNLTRRKGADLLPRIAALLSPEVRILYTSGPRDLARLPAHPRLECVGSVPYAEMPGIYARADVLLYPSVREGFGLSVAEAMACGLPVVATRASSLPELVDEGRGGLLCEPGDVQAFAAALNRLAAAPDERRRMGEYNRARAERDFTLARMAREYQALFEEVLG